MPIPAPGNVDAASQTTLNLVKAQTDKLLFPDANIVKAEPGTRISAVDATGVAAPGSTVLAVTPPAGQTWHIHVVARMVADSADIYAVSIARTGAGGVTITKNGFATAYIGTYGFFEVSNAVPLELIFQNGAAVGKAYAYSYFGWRIV